jgi:hypothetical protein
MFSIKITCQRETTKGTNSYYDLLGLKCQPLEEANTIADCLENQFRTHDLCDKNHKRGAKAEVQALLGTVDNTPLEKVRSRYI